MDPAERQARLSRAVSETLNGLSVFLCGPGFRKHGSDASRTFRQDFETLFALTLREASASLRLAQQRSVRAAVDRIRAVAMAGDALDSPEILSELRAPIRDVISAFLPMPALAPSEAAICELHGSACPFLENGTE
jgi:hypothetical protein